jgi:anti-anti-sigma factor
MTIMQIKNRKVKERLVIEPQTERMDAGIAEEFQNAILELINDGQKNLVVNLRSVQFMDKTAMNTIFSVFKFIKSHGGEMAICEVGESLQNLFALTKLDRQFTICLTEEEALSIR